MPEQKYATPTPSGKVTNPYGATQYRAPGMDGPLPSSNVGADYGAPLGTPAQSPVSGTVVSVYDAQADRNPKENSGWGGSIVIKGEDGSVHRLSHLQRGSPLVKPGDRVQRAQQIASVGETGNAIGAHVDWEYKDANGQRGDPAPLSRSMTMADAPEDVSRRQDVSRPSTLPPPAPRVATPSTLARLQGNEDSIRKQVVDLEKSGLDPYTKADRLKELTGQLTVATNAVAAEENRIRDDAKVPGSTRTADQIAGDALAVKQRQFELDEAIRKRDAIKDPTSPEGRTAALEVSRLEKQVKALDAAAGYAKSADDRAQVAQGLDINADARAGAKLGPEIGRILASTGLDAAQTAQILAKIQPGVDQILAETDFTKARTGELTQTLDAKIRQLAASAGLDEAKITEVTGLLSGRIAQQGAELAQTTAQTGQTGAQTGLIGKQATGVDLANQAETRRQAAWTEIQTQIQNGTLTTPEQIRAAVAKSSTSIKEYTDFLGAETQRLSLEETTRSNQERETQARAATRTAQQGAATEAVGNYGRFGLATAPFQTNVLSALAPVTDLHAAAKSMGLMPDNPIVQSVQKSWEAFTASQQPAGAAAAPVAGAAPAPSAAAIVPPPAAPLTPPQLSVSTTGTPAQASVLNNGTAAEVTRQAAPPPVSDPGTDLARALASIRQANDLQMPDEAAVPGALFAGALRPRMGGAVYE